MARPLRRVLAATALTATLLTVGAPAAQAAAPAAPDAAICVVVFYDPNTGEWWAICFFDQSPLVRWRLVP